MSWNITAIGTPERLKAHIDDLVTRYQPGQNRDELEAAASHLKGLLDQAQDSKHVYELNAHGSASYDVDGVRTWANVGVTLRNAGTLA